MRVRSFLARALGPALLLILGLATGAHAAPACAFPDPPQVLDVSGEAGAKGARLVQVWEADDAPVWWSQTQPEGYPALRARIAAKAGNTDPAFLLAQHPFRNNRIVADGDWVRPINCLEMLLQLTQNQRIDMFDAPTEFMATILRSADGKRLRVYFYTLNEDGIGRTTPVSEPAARDARMGWNVVAAMHNHAFHPGQPALNGPPAPSTADAQFQLNFHRSTGLAEAWITNGLHTARIPSTAFGLFERDGP